PTARQDPRQPGLLGIIDWNGVQGSHPGPGCAACHAWLAQPADFVSTPASLRPGTGMSPPISPHVRGVASRGSVSCQAGVLAARNTTIGRYGCIIGRIASAARDAISLA